MVATYNYGSVYMNLPSMLLTACLQSHVYDYTAMFLQNSRRSITLMQGQVKFHLLNFFVWVRIKSFDTIALTIKCLVVLQLYRPFVQTALKTTFFKTIEFCILNQYV